MGRAWDDAIDREFVARLRRGVKAIIDEYDSRDSAWVHAKKDIGVLAWTEIDSTYGLEEPIEGDDEDEEEDGDEGEG